MPITAQQVSARAGVLLNDVSARRWTVDERLTWINDGRRQMAEVKPEIFGAQTQHVHTLTDGALQRISAPNALKLSSVDAHIREGSKNETAVLPTTRMALDSFRPNWRSETARAVDNWIADETDPLAFWIYPASKGQLRCHVLFMPDDVRMADAALPADLYVPHLVNYVCYRALAKEDEAASVEKAASYLKLFVEGLS